MPDCQGIQCAKKEGLEDSIPITFIITINTLHKFEEYVAESLANHSLYTPRPFDNPKMATGNPPLIDYFFQLKPPLIDDFPNSNVH